MTDPKNKAASRGEATGDANPKTASTKCSLGHRGKRLDVAALRAALADPPSIPALLDDLKRDATGHREELLRDAADAAAEVAELETAFATSTCPAARADIAERLAAALSREVAALEDALSALGGGT